MTRCSHERGWVPIVFVPENVRTCDVIRHNFGQKDAPSDIPEVVFWSCGCQARTCVGGHWTPVITASYSIIP